MRDLQGVRRWSGLREHLMHISEKQGLYGVHEDVCCGPVQVESVHYDP